MPHGIHSALSLGSCISAAVTVLSIRTVAPISAIPETWEAVLASAKQDRLESAS
jgi:hypothetical protein